MADNIYKYLDLTGLGKYDTKIKAWSDNKYPVKADITVKSITNVDGKVDDPVVSNDGTTWNLNLAKFALKSDLVAVLKFMGVVNYVSDLPTGLGEVEVKKGHIYHVKYKGTSGTDPLNAEYICTADPDKTATPQVPATWEEMGTIIDLSEYAKKSEVTAAVAAEATARDLAISTAIAALDATVSLDQTSRTDGLSLTITETDGKLTAVSGSIAANTYDAYGSAAAVLTRSGSEGAYTYSGYAKDYTDGEIAKLSLTDPGAEGKFISSVSQSNGAVSASATSFVSSISTTTYGENEGKIAPSAKATQTYVKTEVSAEATAREAADNAIMKREGSAGSYTYSGYAKDYTDSVVEGLDATVRGNLNNDDTIATGKKVGVKVVEENGKLTSVSVVENDIASATTLATVNGDATTDGSFRKYTTDAIAALDVDTATGDYLTQIAETDGKISNLSWGTSISTAAGCTSEATALVQGKAVKAYADTVGTAAASDATSKANAAKVYVAEAGAITSTQINGLQAITETEINTLFA